jgi:uncharacterized protein (TIGR01244 family)
MLTSDRRVSIRARVCARALTLALACSWAGLALSQIQGVDLPNRKDPLYGITASGQPSAEQLTAAAAAGFKTVIDLRTASEDRGMDEKATVEKLGMGYLSLPVDGAKGVTYANATALDKMLSDASRPVLIHCSSGNRVGALLALRAKLKGADAEPALAIGVAGGLTRLEDTVEQKLAAGHD